MSYDLLMADELLEIKSPEVLYYVTPASDDGNYRPVAPYKGTTGSAGFDLYAPSDVTIKPRESVLVSTGVHMGIPKDWVGIICPRSSVAYKTPLRIGARVIDSDYRGDVMINLINDSDEEYKVIQGTRIAQILYVQYLPSMTHVNSIEELDGLQDDQLAVTKRGAGGFGSTGM